MSVFSISAHTFFPKKLPKKIRRIRENVKQIDILPFITLTSILCLLKPFLYSFYNRLQYLDPRIILVISLYNNPWSIGR